MKKVFMSLGALTLFVGGVLAGHAKFSTPISLYITDGTPNGCHQISSSNSYTNLTTTPSGVSPQQAAINTVGNNNLRKMFATSTCKTKAVYLD